MGSEMCIRDRLHAVENELKLQERRHLPLSNKSQFPLHPPIVLLTVDGRVLATELLLSAISVWRSLLINSKPKSAPRYMLASRRRERSPGNCGSWVSVAALLYGRMTHVGGVVDDHQTVLGAAG